MQAYLLCSSRNLVRDKTYTFFIAPLCQLLKNAIFFYLRSAI